MHQHVIHGPLGQALAVLAHLQERLDDECGSVLCADAELGVVELLAPPLFEERPHTLDGVELRGGRRHVLQLNPQLVRQVDGGGGPVGLVVVQHHHAKLAGAVIGITRDVRLDVQEELLDVLRARLRCQGELEVIPVIRDATEDRNGLAPLPIEADVDELTSGHPEALHLLPEVSAGLIEVDNLLAARHVRQQLPQETYFLICLLVLTAEPSIELEGGPPPDDAVRLVDVQQGRSRDLEPVEALVAAPVFGLPLQRSAASCHGEMAPSRQGVGADDMLAYAHGNFSRTPRRQLPPELPMLQVHAQKRRHRPRLHSDSRGNLPVGQWLRALVAALRAAS